MEERYIRNIPALEQQEQQLLATKKVLVAGCGGLGGHVIELLLRLGVGAITAVDSDVFEQSNLNRQLLAQAQLLGKSKAEAAAERAAAVNGEVAFEAIHARIDETNAAALIAGCDVVIDALDTVESRKCLFAACSEAGVPFVHGAVGSWNVQAAVCAPGSELLDILYPPHVRATNKSVLSFTPAMCAAMQVSLAAQYLCGRPVEMNRLYLYDLQHMEGASFTLG